MRNLFRSLIPAALLIALAWAPAPAQQAADAPVNMTTAELTMWEAWLRGDQQACYLAAQSILENRQAAGDAFTVALSLQAACVHQLGWHDAHGRDLRRLLEVYADDQTREPAIRWELITRLKHMGKTSDIPAQVKALGILTGWQLCGPFPNDRGQGFEDASEPELELNLESEYRGMEGQPVGFRPLPVKPLDGVIDLGAMLRPATEATAFLICAVHVEAAGSARLHVGSTEDVKVWHYGRSLEDDDADSPLGTPILESRDERPIGLDQSSVSFSLNSGWNVLVVKTGNAETEWLFNARLECSEPWQAAAASELAAIVAELQPWETEDDTEIADGRDGTFYGAAAELLNPRLDRATTMPRRWMDPAVAQLRATNPQAGSVAARELAVLCYVAAWANRSSARFAAGREENRRRELLKECLDLYPSAARAALELCQYYTTTFTNPALADEYATLAVKANPDWSESRLYSSRVVAMKGLDIEVERELAKLLQERPTDSVVLRAAAYYAGLRRDYKLSNELFERVLKADFADSYARDRLLERAVARGDTQACIKLAADARTLNPFDTHAALQLAELFMNAEQYTLAEREIKRALEIAPRDDGLLHRLGEIYTAWADTDETRAAELRAQALEAYQAALDANPRREDIERYIEFIEGDQPVFEAALQERIDSRIAAALELPIEGDDAYEVIYRDEIVVVNDDGTTARYIHEAYRVTNDTGREWLQRIPVPAWDDQQGRCVEARVWRADGDIEEGRRSSWVASFPPLDVGDIVQVRFRVTDRQQSFFGNFYGTLTVLMDYVPIRELRQVWVLPAGRTFYEYRTGNAPAREESTVEGRRVWSYRAENLPKLHDEPLAPEPHMVSPTIQLSTYETWREWGRWYYNLIRKQMEPTSEMTAKVKELTAGLEAERDKARAVYNWVVTHVRYNADWHFGVHGYKPFSAGAVFARAIGDCKDKSILICAMLEIAGVKAYPVIINMEPWRGEEDITLPMPDHFNHAIAYIEYSDGTGQFVDGTATYNGINELPGADRGANVIVIRPDGGTRVQIDPGKPEDDCHTEDMTIEFAPGGTLKLTVKLTAVGDAASYLRARFEREGDRKRVLESEWSDYFPGAKVGEVTTNDLSNLDATPEINYTIELPNAYTTGERGIEFRTALFPEEWTQSAYGALTARRTDLRTRAPAKSISTARFTVPDGYSAELPPALRLEHPNIKLSVVAELKDGVVTIQRQHSLLGGTVKAADYPAFRQQLIQYDKAEAANFTLTRKR